LASALDRLIDTGLLFRQGVQPHVTHLFKRALVQDAAYGTPLREPRHALHARVAETLEGRFADIAETQPEVLARHCTEAGLTEKAAGLWAKQVKGHWREPPYLRGQSRSIGRSQSTIQPNTVRLRRALAGMSV
jgi:hypothetical protein